MDEVSQLPSEAHMYFYSSLRDKEFMTQTLQSVSQVHTYYLNTGTCVFLPLVPVFDTKAMLLW